MKNVRFLTVSEVLKLHKLQIQDFGGADGIRSGELLESAVMQPQSGFGGFMLHKNIIEMAAAYLFHICQNHPFVDGNKRTALDACYFFLFFNGYELSGNEDEIADFVLDVAAGKAKKSDVARFLKRNTTKLNN